MGCRFALPVLGVVLAATACSSALWPRAASSPTTLARGRCTIVVARPGGDWSGWDEQLCTASAEGAHPRQSWLAPLVAQAVDDAEVAACGAPRCAAHDRAVRFYVVPSSTPALISERDDETVAVVLSSALVDRAGRDAGFYELAFAHELARLRLGETCGEGVQSDELLRAGSCDREALGWLTRLHPNDEAWAQRERMLAGARSR
ncbi:MAG TPA: hypothetical protein VF765_29710 [Polyangiaceae bacterium]